MRLPSPESLAARTFTGTITRRSCGFSPAWSMSLRSAPAQTLSTRSLSVSSRPRRKAFIRASGTACRTSRRRGPMSTLSIEGGAERSTSPARDIAARRTLSATRRPVPGESPSRATWRAVRNWSSAESASESSTSFTGPPLPGAGSHSAGVTGRASGLASNSSTPSSTAAMPSTIAWWTLPTIAARPPSTDGTTSRDHRGRSRRSCTDRKPSVSSPNRRRDTFGSSTTCT